MLYDISAAVLDNYLAARDTHAIWLHAPDIARAANPGQFVMIEAPGKFLRRPMSVARCEGGRILILVRIVGEGTEALCKLRRNQRVRLLGPLGNGFPEGIDEVVLVAGGIGIAPILFAAQRLEETGAKFHLLYGERTAEYIVKRPLLPTFAEISTDDGSAGFHGTVIDLLAQKKPGHIFACGPRGMLTAVSDVAKRWHKKAWLSLEQVMACGFGVCGGCAIETKKGYRLTCADGPVFSAEELCLEIGHTRF